MVQEVCSQVQYRVMVFLGVRQVGNGLGWSRFFGM